MALYDEAARWGDYRRDVHQYTKKGKLYTVDETYQTERQRLLNSYFPVRTGKVLDHIVAFVGIDDLEHQLDIASVVKGCPIDGRLYTLNGQLVGSHPGKGVYIKNGRKIAIK
jgi:hypothetical protein